MRFIIPQDWDNETWKCYQIEWPDSTFWLAILNGLLSYPMRGRSWDETSGVITDVQTIGREIWERNNALIECNGEPSPPEVIEIIRRIICEVESEDDDMACQGPNPPIKIEEGNLYFWWCCEWVLVGNLSDTAEDLGDDPLAPDPPVYSACGKAYALSEVLFSIANNCWDEIDNLPWQWIGHVEEDVHVDLDNKWVIATINQSIIMTGVGYERAGVMPTSAKDWLRAYIASILEDDATGVTEDQYNDIRSAFGSHLGIDPFKRNFWDYVFFALGWKDANNIAKLGATDTTEDCEEPPEGITDPTPTWDDVDWAHFWDFTIGDDYLDWTPNAATAHIPGQGWVDWGNTGTGYAKTAIYASMPGDSGGGHIIRCWAALKIGNGFDWDSDAYKGTTDAQTIFGPGSPGGDPITAGGDIIDQRIVDKTLSGSDDHINWIMEGNMDPIPTDPEDPNSPFILAIAIGGTGVDPFVAP